MFPTEYNQQPRITRRRFIANAGLAIGAAALASTVARARADATGRAAATETTVPGPFATSTPTLTDRLNEYWAIYGTAAGTPATAEAQAAGALSAMGLNTAWDEWDSLKFRWTATGGFQTTLLDQFATLNPINGLHGTTGAQPDGYVWSWPNLETWPDNNSFHNNQGSYHFDQVPRFVIAVAELALWTRNHAFIQDLLPSAEFVMDRYLLGAMHGTTGVLTESTINPAAPSDGTSEGRPGNYMDEVRFGYQDAWVNGAFFTALERLAELERLVGNPGKAERYAELAGQVPRYYDATFWNPVTNRYAGWVDKNGNRHDAGYTFVNLEAVARGIADQKRAFQILDFLETAAQPTDPQGVPAGCVAPTCTYPPSAHPGSTDVYQLVVAPRANTVEVPLADWDGWSDTPGAGRRPYGAVCENGGAFMWEAYYDILTRFGSWGPTLPSPNSGPCSPEWRQSRLG